VRKSKDPGITQVIWLSYRALQNKDSINNSYFYRQNETNVLQKLSYYFMEAMSVNIGPCHQNKACPQVSDGRECFQIWRVAENILNTVWDRQQRVVL
jgi:hypothetical protein